MTVSIYYNNQEEMAFVDYTEVSEVKIQPGHAIKGWEEMGLEVQTMYLRLEMEDLSTATWAIDEIIRFRCR